MNNDTKPIIIVDDNDDELFLSIRLYKKSSSTHPLITCTSGSELIRVLKELKEKPFLVLLDINMPGLDGFQTLKLIRESEDIKDTKVIFFTNSTSARDMEIAKDIPSDGFVVKPSKSKEMVSFFNSMLAS